MYKMKLIQDEDSVYPRTYPFVNHLWSTLHYYAHYTLFANNDKIFFG